MILFWVGLAVVSLITYALIELESKLNESNW
jgi:NADH:ubiquinone oxidoreductase subunit 2 (subunit N)